MKNQITVKQDHAIVTTKVGQDILVDIDDVSLVSQFTWRVKIKPGRNTNYAYTHLWQKGAGSPNPIDGKGLGKGYKSLAIHKLIMGQIPLLDLLLEGYQDETPQVDHIDGNGLNNQKSNLRYASQSQNGGWRQGLHKNNKTGYTGVFKTATNMFISVIGHNSKSEYIGTFNTAEEAAYNWNKKCSQYRGEFAKLNMIPSEIEKKLKLLDDTQ